MKISNGKRIVDILHRVKNSLVVDTHFFLVEKIESCQFIFNFVNFSRSECIELNTKKQLLGSVTEKFHQLNTSASTKRF